MPPQKLSKSLPYNRSRLLARAKAKEFTVHSGGWTYRNREDKTNLPPTTLITGSHDVLTNVSGRVASRKGYTLDGGSSSVLGGILSSYDYEMHTGTIQHLRAGWLTSALNDGKLEYRYKDSSGVVTWRTLLSSLVSTSFNFTDYWDTAHLQSLVLMVNGAGSITEWTGGVATLASASNTSIGTVAVTAGGSGYVVGDVLTLTTGGGNATVTVATLSGSGVSTVTVLNPGTGYSTGAGQATSGGTGSGATLNVSALQGTITITGTTTWAQNGFYTTGTHSVTVNGTNYQATGGWGTLYLTGVTPDPSALVAGAIVHQTPETTLNASLSGLATVTNDLISNLRNQIYVASFTNRSIYISKVNNYKDYTFTSPVRIVGEGALCTLDGNPTALIPQDVAMYVSAGLNQWYQTQFTLSSDNTKEDFQIVRLKTGALQGTQSQGLTTKISNYIVYVSNEPVLQQLGYVENNIQTPQLSDLSFPIVNDMNSYIFSGGHIQYHKKFVYVSVPSSSTMRVYNMTSSDVDPVTSLPKHFYESPLTLPIGCFSIIDGNLYGHDFNVPQTYKLFDGYNDNGNFINAVAMFAFDNNEGRSISKGFNEYFVEGYISSNTTLSMGMQYDLDGCATVTSSDILGTDGKIVCIGGDDNSLGKTSHGKSPLGSDLLQTTPQSLPPKFRVIKTMDKVPYYEYSPSFSSNGLDQQWELLSFGPAWSSTSEGSNDITE